MRRESVVIVRKSDVERSKKIPALRSPEIKKVVSKNISERILSLFCKSKTQEHWTDFFFKFTQTLYLVYKKAGKHIFKINPHYFPKFLFLNWILGPYWVPTFII